MLQLAPMVTLPRRFHIGDSSARASRLITTARIPWINTQDHFNATREDHLMDRTPEPEGSSERELLLGWLDFHRDALTAKCAGLDDEQLARASAPPSTLSLLGLVRHLTEMERHYLVDALGGTSEGLLYCTEENPEADIEGLDASMVPASMTGWVE